ncbi:arylesterase [Pseudidiomarina terrestris]|uniref:Arylesterase n=1 Tax=Pseudidiomarina terrestris TaxID=2820060 RepID=A0AAW7QTD3_9GAMM|nr:MULTISPECIES: arylesterase [unclassified Pseudidiomarina]MDN7123485.1 arylesterase [Pseudidiomarina sp. 1APP75-32.1]MDN7126725.1 arylesterase [Pseudidiomarina sp. 1APR75-33.1]MDN7128790.1 arylesterase [Pseudidiomarina sp. 1APR75-15]MDN7134942.1 arylesterase [Pseudidiomarina sp. 1ASP75-5]MDN7137621.1 arylesterase [Pseudidiomarina sp. 1ASP75-14]
MKNFLIKFGFIVALLVLVRPVYGNVSLVVLGDSLSAGYGMSQQQSWVGVLQQRWQQTHPSIELINASISGDTTQGALNRLEGIIKTHQPDAVFVELGGNDGLRGFTPTTIKSNLLQIINRLQEENIKVAVSQIIIPPNYGRRYSDMFADIFPELATSTDTLLIPFFMEQIATKPELMQNDGIHPNEDAQDDIADIMEPHLLKLLSR